MDISDWRKKIDELDRKLAALLNERAAAAVEIGRLKRNTSLPVYEPEREREVIANVQRNNTGPLAARDRADLRTNHGRMRSIEKHEIVPHSGQQPTKPRSIEDSGKYRRHPGKAANADVRR